MNCDVARTLRWIAGVALALIILTMTVQVLLLVFAGVLIAIPGGIIFVFHSPNCNQAFRIRRV